MKHLAAFFLLVLVLSCKHTIEEYDFVVICKFPPEYSFSRDARLIITDQDGEFIDNYEISQGVIEVERRIKIYSNDPLEICDIHLIFEPDPNSPAYLVFSHLGVHNAATVVFAPEVFLQPPGGVLHSSVILVQGVHALDSLGFLGSYSSKEFFPNSNTALVTFYFQGKQGVIVHIKGNNEAGFRYLYLPEERLTDTVRVHWDEFKPEPPPSLIKAPENALVTQLEALILSEEYDAFASLGNYYSYAGPFTPQLIRPNDVSGDIRVRVAGDGFVAERIFRANEPIEFEPSGIKINKAISTPGAFLDIDTEGDIDLLEVSSFSPGYGGPDGLPGVLWRIEGKPEFFSDLRIPNLQPFTYGLVNYSTLFTHFTVKAHQYEKHDYTQVREGYPIRTNDGKLFPVARSGYHMIEKSF